MNGLFQKPKGLYQTALTAHEISSWRLDKPDPPYEPKAVVSYRLILPSPPYTYSMCVLHSDHNVVAGGMEGDSEIN